ncbi:hypothetical protein FF1_037711 [Malus domestica]
MIETRRLSSRNTGTAAAPIPNSVPYIAGLEHIPLAPPVALTVPCHVARNDDTQATASTRGEEGRATAAATTPVTSPMGFIMPPTEAIMTSIVPKKRLPQIRLGFHKPWCAKP